MKKYFRLQQDIFAEYVAESTQEQILGTVYFGHGSIISTALPKPLIFEIGHTLHEPPKGLLSNRYPVMSDELIAALQDAGVSNLQCFSAEVRSSADGTIWRIIKW